MKRKRRLMSHCPECGGAVRILAKAGRHMTYKNIRDIEVPASLGIPTCQNCGGEWMNDTVAAKIDRVMETVYRARLRAMARRAIAVITAVINQGELERKLGMAQGYLTKLKHGHRDPSPEIAIQLCMIALQPKQRLREIDALLRQAL